MSDSAGMPGSLLEKLQQEAAVGGEGGDGDIQPSPDGNGDGSSSNQPPPDGDGGNATSPSPSSDSSTDASPPPPSESPPPSPPPPSPPPPPPPPDDASPPLPSEEKSTPSPSPSPPPPSESEQPPQQPSSSPSPPPPQISTPSDDKSPPTETPSASPSPPPPSITPNPTVPATGGAVTHPSPVIPSSPIHPSTPAVWNPPPATHKDAVSTPATHKDASATAGSESGTGANSNGSSDSAQKAAVGVAVASVFLIAFVAIFFVVSKRRKRRKTDNMYHQSPYMPPGGGGNFSVKSDGYYYGQQPNSQTHSGQMDQYQQHSGMMSGGFGSRRGQYSGPDSGVISGGKSHFSYEELMEVTGGFSRDRIIGEGGFGCVYKGTLPDGRVVAVKQLKAGSGQGDREFRAEVEIISRVHHRYLVSLVGYSVAESHRSLIYEFVPNNTLEHHLHAKGLAPLSWTNRVKIAVGSAKGLAYLHEDCHPKIIHRDIKSANILLDNDFEAKVADFGLARLNDTTQTHVSTRVMGTFGYLAPEYASSGKLTDRSDVFSFGVVLLELITGRKPVDPTQPLGDESLVEWARPHLLNALQTGDVSELIDPRLEKHYVEIEVLKMIDVAAACVRHSAPKRPRMVQVVRTLDSDGDMPDLSNGVKYGQSTVYDSGQYSQDIMKFRMMALGGDGGSMDYDMNSGDHTSRDGSRGFPSSWKSSGEFTSGESETQAINGKYRPRF